MIGPKQRIRESGAGLPLALLALFLAPLGGLVIWASVTVEDASRDLAGPRVDLVFEPRRVARTPGPKAARPSTESRTEPAPAPSSATPEGNTSSFN